MLIGVADLSFIASPDFTLIMENLDDVEFAIYSPLEWLIWQNRYSVNDERTPKKVENIKKYLEWKLIVSKKLEVNTLINNLQIGFKEGYLLPIRSDFTKPYSSLNKVTTSKQEFQKIMYRDLSNILLAGKLGLPLWTEYGAEKWITENYHFKITQESELINYPIFYGNPTSRIKEVIINIINSTIRNESFEKIKSDIIKNIPTSIGFSYFFKNFMLNVIEPLPIWDMLPEYSRVFASGILLIVDVGGIIKNQKKE